jgi:aryl-phospho-beta-D-glucosidase BglC (GH1 family)
VRRKKTQPNPTQPSKTNQTNNGFFLFLVCFVCLSAVHSFTHQLHRAYSNGLTVLLDIHTMKDSQNGFDNSGQAMGFQWTTALNSEYVHEQTFEHWPIRDARWIGTFDQNTGSYASINYENIQHSLDVIEAIVNRYRLHPAVHGIEVRTKH